MATKGSFAKAEVINKIKKAFGEDFIGEVDKKIYLWANDGPNGQTQIAISLTCPKIQLDAATVSVESTPKEALNWDSPTISAAPPSKPAIISAEEEASIAEMMKRLGL